MIYRGTISRHHKPCTLRLSALMSTTKVAPLAAIFLLLLFVAQGIFFIHVNSQTIDEAMHVAAGYSYLAKGDFRIEPQNPPLIKELLALPLFLAYRLPFNPDPQQWCDADGFCIGQDVLYESTIPADQMLRSWRCSAIERLRLTLPRIRRVGVLRTCSLPTS